MSRIDAIDADIAALDTQRSAPDPVVPAAGRLEEFSGAGPVTGRAQVPLATRLSTLHCDVYHIDAGVNYESEIAMTTVTSVRTVDDARVTLAFADAYRGQASAWTGHVRYTPRRTGHDATSDLWGLELAPLSSYAAGVASVGGRERERFALAGGEVVVFDCADVPDARWAAWLGPWHMAHGLFYAPQWDSVDIIETFSRVRWQDTPEGMVADAGRRYDLQRAVYLLPVAGVGTMLVESSRREADRVPAWRGFSGRVGEIWRLPKGNSGGPEPLMLVSDSALVTISPWSEASAGRGVTSADDARLTEKAADFLSSLERADWQG